MRISPTTRYVLKALVPYSKANMQLSFSPNKFFNDLERLDRINERTLRSAFYRAQRKGLIKIDSEGIPRLTPKGLTATKTYKPTKLGKNAYILLIFDIPESERRKRDHLRALLRELSFKKIQQSVWACRYDHREYLAAEIKEYGLENYVIVYEAAYLPIK
ncbi:CRISPR-associated endonuclease Cas2 [Candidatus Saccharibacteria bacterium RIFCSPHIGHO2_02_FULL_47_12]|nr:MAG: CRISPR-associated endonuclease Cas2 [Candidatus Saccharibacteria bacterium RIFCSPHIGHO2_02_FULL_47_12]